MCTVRSSVKLEKATKVFDLGFKQSTMRQMNKIQDCCSSPSEWAFCSPEGGEKEPEG